MKNLLVIFRRELAAYFNSPIAYIFLIVFLAFNNGLFMLQFFHTAKADMRPFFGMLPYVLNIFIPAITMRLWAEDKRDHTFELLLTFPMKPHELVLGKYLAGLVFYLFALATTLTVPLMISLVGSVDMGPIAGGYIGAAWMGALFLAVGIFISGLCKDQIVAFVLGMIATFVLFFAGTGLMAALLDGWIPGLGTFVKNTIGVAGRTEGFGRGILDSGDALFFLTGAAVFLFLNGLALEGRFRPRSRLVYSGAVAAAFCSLVLFNGLLAGAPLGRWDITSGKVHTLSAVSAKILKELKVPAYTKLYITAPDRMPTALNTLEQDVTDKLEELRIASGDKLKYQVIHVETPKDDAEQRELEDRGVMPFQVESIQRDEVGVKVIYSTLTIEYKEKPIEVIPRVVPAVLYDFEYQLMSRIKKLMLEERPIIAVFAPVKQEELSPDAAAALAASGQAADSTGSPQAPKTVRDEFATATALIRQNGYDTRRITLTKESPIPEKTKALLVFNPGSLMPRQLYEIGRYLRGGGQVLIAAQGFEYTFERQGADLAAVPKRLTLEINTLIGKWGVRIGEDILLDESSQMISLATGARIGPYALEMPVKFPNQIVVAESSFNRSVPMTKRIPGLFYLWGSALDVDEKAAKDKGLEAAVLFTSSPRSWRTPHDGSTKLTPQNTAFPGERAASKFPLAVLLEGVFPETASEAPPWKEGEAAEKAEAPAPRPARLIVVGAHKVFGEESIQNPGNLNLFANVVDVFALGEDLVQIRSKAMVVRDVRRLSGAEKLAYRFLAVGLMPLLIAALGIIRRALRKKEKELYVEALSK